MVERSAHSAAGQALGYVHQCLWALVELGKKAAYEPRTQLRLEALDDIELGTQGQPTELIQVKHHIGDSTLTAKSVDLWRTLNVWMDLGADDDVMLRLVTTEKLHDDSDLSGLRSGEKRDSAIALIALLRAAAESKSSATHVWRKKFIDLDDDVRDFLVGRIYVIDGSVQSSNIDVALLQTFRYACLGKEQVFLDLLKGWWSGISVRLLAGTLDAVTGTDLLNQVNDITDQLRSDTLPVDPNVFKEYDASIEDVYQDRAFVQQLVWIAMDHERLWKAIRDYHRSFAQRSFWLRHQLLAETELDRYAFKLHDEWEQIFDSRVAEMRRSQRVDAEDIGQDIFESFARESRARLRERFDESWFNRGMFHALADGELGSDRQIGWHPSFTTKLRVLLNHA